MRRLPALLILGSLGLILPQGASAMDGFGPVKRPVFRSGPGFGFHGPGHFRREPFFPRFVHGLGRFRGGPFFPGFLEGRSGDVNVIVSQNVVTVAAPPAIPTVLDLPTSAGIRVAQPAQPAVVVVNERSRASTAPPVRVLSEGPRIITIGSDQAPAAPAPAFGARIVHLAVRADR